MARLFGDEGKEQYLQFGLVEQSPAPAAMTRTAPVAASTAAPEGSAAKWPAEAPATRASLCGVTGAEAATDSMSSVSVPLTPAEHGTGQAGF